SADGPQPNPSRPPARGNHARTQAQHVQPPVKAGMLDFNATVHYDLEAGLPGALGRFLVDHAELHPYHLGACGYRVLDYFGHGRRLAEDIDNLDRPGRIAYGCVTGPAQNLLFAWIHRDDVVPLR